MCMCDVVWYESENKHVFVLLFLPIYHHSSAEVTPVLQTAHTIYVVNSEKYVSVNLELPFAKSQGRRKAAACERYFDILVGLCIDRDALIKEQQRVCGQKANTILSALLAAGLLSAQPFPGNRLSEWAYLCAFCRPWPQPSPSTSSLSSNHSASPNVTSSAPSSARGENCIWRN